MGGPTPHAGADPTVLPDWVPDQGIIIPKIVEDACFARLHELDEDTVDFYCSEVEAAVRRLPLKAGDTTAAAVAAAAAVADPDAPGEVAKLLKAYAELECVRLQLAAAGEMVGQAGQVLLKSAGQGKTGWGVAEYRMLLASARRGQLLQAMKAAEAELVAVQLAVKDARAVQQLIVNSIW